MWTGKKVPLNVALDADPKRSLSVQLEQKEAARAFCLDSAVGGWRETVGTASDPNRCNQFITAGKRVKILRVRSAEIITNDRFLAMFKHKLVSNSSK